LLESAPKYYQSTTLNEPKKNNNNRLNFFVLYKKLTITEFFFKFCLCKLSLAALILFMQVMYIIYINMEMCTNGCTIVVTYHANDLYILHVSHVWCVCIALICGNAPFAHSIIFVLPSYRKVQRLTSRITMEKLRCTVPA